MATPPQAQLTPLGEDSAVHGIELQLPSFDGSPLSGRLLYPDDPTQADTPYPVLIGLHALGRSHYRWRHGAHKGGVTLENTHRITELALRKGYAVLAVDARNHGVRKDPERNVLQVMNGLHLWGKREPYEQMIVDTVRDYRLLLDWVQTQPQLDSNHIRVAGYSMGAQMALLLGGMDERIDAVLAVVPPHLDDKVAIAAPRNALSGLADKKVWLLSADDDEYASQTQNLALSKRCRPPTSATSDSPEVICCLSSTRRPWAIGSDECRSQRATGDLLHRGRPEQTFWNRNCHA